MPVDETPLAHVVVAVATKCTGDDVEVPVKGDETETAARAGIAASTMVQSKILMCTPAWALPSCAHDSLAETARIVEQRKEANCGNSTDASTYVQALRMNT
jgi:hypothetical protein